MPNMICRSPPWSSDPAAAVGHVVEELVGLVGAGRHPQRLDGERRVPDPRVAVVPVAGAADHLGQRGGGRRADRAGGLERQRLEHASAVVDEVAPRTDVRLVQLRPRLPRRHGVVEPRRDLVLAPDPGRPGRRPAARGAARSRPALPARRTTGPTRTTPSTSSGTGHDRTRTSAPPVATSPPSTASSSGSTRPYSGRGTYSTSISTSPSLHVTCRSRRCGDVLGPGRGPGSRALSPARRRPRRSPWACGRSSPGPWCGPRSGG